MEQKGQIVEASDRWSWWLIDGDDEQANWQAEEEHLQCVREASKRELLLE